MAPVAAAPRVRYHGGSDIRKEWACSAAGSAPEWHSGGHRFDPGQVHHPLFFMFEGRKTLEK